jgi:hypothetical protein
MPTARFLFASRVAGRRIFAVGGEGYHAWRKVEAFNSRKP